MRPHGCCPVTPSARRAFVDLARTTATAVLAACASLPPPAPPTPSADPARRAEELAAATTPSRPQRAVFRWELQQGLARFRGQGVVRYQAPERLRLDLFDAQGRTVLVAALVADSLRLPGALPAGLDLPSPTLLWAAIGVFRPPHNARLLGGAEDDTTLLLRYGLDGQRLDVRARRGPPIRLWRVDRSGATGVLETVEWIDSLGAEVRYLDRANGRELRLVYEHREDASPFPAEIWRPLGRR